MQSAGPYASAPRSRQDNYASTPPLSFLQARRSSCRPTNSVKALKAKSTEGMKNKLVKNIVTHFSSKGSVTPSVSVLKVAVKYNWIWCHESTVKTQQTERITTAMVKCLQPENTEFYKTMITVMPRVEQVFAQVTSKHSLFHNTWPLQSRALWPGWKECPKSHDQLTSLA